MCSPTVLTIIFTDQKLSELCAALRQKKERITPKIANIAFYGPSRAGKSTVMRSVLRMNYPNTSYSTGVANTIGGLIDPETLLAMFENEEFRPLAEDDGEVAGERNIRTLLVYFVHLVKNKKLTTKESSAVRAESDSSLDENTSTDISEVPPDGVIPEELNDSQLQGIEDSLLEIGDAELGKMFEDLKKCMIVTFLDTGGQCEFAELLPILFAGANTNIFVYNMTYSLDDRYISVYEYPDKTCRDGYISQATSAELMRQYFDSNPKSTWLIVSTHNDLVRDEFSDIKSKNLETYEFSDIKSKNLETLNKICEDSPHVNLQTRPLAKSFNVEKNPDHEEVKELRRAVSTKLKDLQSEPNDSEVPLWYIFLIFVFRQCKHPISHIDECMELAKEFCDSRNELEDALLFLGDKLGAVKYFKGKPKISELVVCNTEILYKKITEIVEESFFIRKYHNKLQPANISKTSQNGIIDDDKLRTIFGACFSPKVNQDKVNQDMAIILLQELKIITKLETPSGNKPIFLFPCALQIYPVEILRFKCPEDPAYPSPILFRFSHPDEPGNFCYFPIGCFPELIVTLEKKKEEGKKIWKFETKRCFRNMVEIWYKNEIMITLVCRLKYLELYIEPKEDCDKYGRICPEIKSAIEEQIKEIVKPRKFLDEHKLSSYFHWPPNSDNRDHLTEATEVSVCCKQHGCAKLLEQHKYWLDKVCN